MTPRRTTLALLASLALNLFLGGILVGGVVIAHRLHGPMMIHHPGPHPLWAAADGLDPADRQAFHHLLHDQAETVGRQIQAAHRAHQAAWAKLNAEPFDPAGTARGLAEARALEMQARGGVEQRVIDFAATLPPAKRALLAAGLAKSAAHPVMVQIRHGPPEGQPPGP